MDRNSVEGSTVALEKEYKTKSSDQITAEQIPVDKRHVVRITMYLFGITCLLPWNFFIQANDYWMYKFRNVSNNDTNDKTELQATFSSYLAIASKVPYVLFLLANAIVANRFRSVTRVQIPLLVMIILFVITVILAPVNTDEHQRAFFGATISIVVAINVMCGFLQGAGTGIAGCFPKVYMGYNVNGMAIGGVLASFAQVISLVGGTSPVISAIMYFVSAILILCLTFVFFRITVKTEFYEYYMSKQNTSTNSPWISNTKLNLDIFQNIRTYALSITLIFWVTLSVLPAVLVLVTSTSSVKNIWTDQLFIPLAGFFVFNVFDLMGRMLALKKPIPSRFSMLTLALTIARVGFIPLIMLCNANPRSHLPVVFGNDASFIIIIIFFAVTNGYLANVILTQAPKCVESSYQELAGSQMAFFLGLGLMLGSVTSYGLLKLL